MTSSEDLEALRPSPADMRVVTSDGSTIAAHSSVLASASPVLERMIERAPRIQLDLLHLLHDADQREKRWERERASQDVYCQLSDAMASLDRAFTEASPCDDDGSGACTARQGLVQLVRHLAGCGNKAGGGGCPHCKRIFQLLRLHSSVCDRAEPCRVPLCSNLKMKMQVEKVDKTWRLLVKKVARAGVMATLANREMPEIVKRSCAKYNSGGSRSRAARFR